MRSFPKIFSLFLIFVAASGNCLAEQRLKVGVIAGFTGDWAGYGESYRRGIEMAAVDQDIEFIYEDDQFIPVKTVTAFQKLANSDHVDAVIVGDTSTALAIAEIARNKKILTLVWANFHGEFSGNPYILRLWPENAKDFGTTLEELKQQAYQKTALYVAAHGYSHPWGESIKAGFPGVQLLEEFNGDISDFQPYILKAKKQGYDSVGLCLNPGMNGVFALQMQNLGVKLPVFACNFLEGKIDLEKAKGALEGSWFTGPAMAPAFVKQYQEKFGRSDHVFSTAIHYEAALYLAAAHKLPGSQNLAERMATTQLTKSAFTASKVISRADDQYLDFEFDKYVIKDSDVVASK